jgi:hypothetical protein
MAQNTRRLLLADALAFPSSGVSLHCPNSNFVTPWISDAPTASVAISAAFISPSLTLAAVTAFVARSAVLPVHRLCHDPTVFAANARSSGEARNVPATNATKDIIPIVNDCFIVCQLRPRYKR